MTQNYAKPICDECKSTIKIIENKHTHWCDTVYAFQNDISTYPVWHVHYDKKATLAKMHKSSLKYVFGNGETCSCGVNLNTIRYARIHINTEIRLITFSNTLYNYYNRR